MIGLLRQPLLWFLLIAAVLFALDSLLATRPEEIFVSRAQQERLATLWTTQTGLVASEEELDSLVQNWVREEALYREALRLGLDQEDSIVRRRLVQKLGFIAESEQQSVPDSAELEAYYRDNVGDYTLPERYSFRQLYFESSATAEQALAAIRAGTDPTGLGTSTLLNASYAYRSELDLNATFGFGFATSLRELAQGSWQGPVQSGFGYHLVQLTGIEGEQVSPFEAVRQQVGMDYQRYREEHARDAYVERLLQSYDVLVEARR